MLTGPTIILDGATLTPDAVDAVAPGAASNVYFERVEILG
jgi:hypothetical protein